MNSQFLKPLAFVNNQLKQELGSGTTGVLSAVTGVSGVCVSLSVVVGTFGVLGVSLPGTVTG